jgi:hypothetical protein
MSLFSRRNRKKAAYAAGFLIVIVGLLLLIFPGLIPASPATVTPVPVSPYQPIVQEQVAVLPYTVPGNRVELDVVVQLRNLNARVGISNYPVTIQILSPSGEELIRHVETTYLLPGALQYVVALRLGLNAGESFGSVNIELPETPQYQELPDTISVPTFNTFLRERTSRQVGNTTIETQTGLVRNTGTFSWQRVEVVVVALDGNRSIIAAGKTFLGALEVNEQREFTVQWPLPSAAISQVVALPSTDIFREENIIRILGNPESLR